MYHRLCDWEVVNLGFSVSCAAEFLCDLGWNTLPSGALVSAATLSRSGL